MTAFLEAIGKYFFKSAIVDTISTPSPSFRRISLRGEELRDVRFQPGDKVQVHIPGGGMRTYTPLSWAPTTGRTELLVFLHGDGPGARWGQSITANATVQLFGPRRSLDVPGKDPLVLFGDETSFAVAHAYQTAGRHVLPVLEVRAPEEAKTVAMALGLEDTILIERTADETHLATVYVHLTTHLGRGENALALTGRAQAIQALRRMDRDRGQKAKATKAYWSLGKRGLD